MRLRDVLVVLDGSSRGEAALGVAIAIARRFDAHLGGFCPLELLASARINLALAGYPSIVAVAEASQRFEIEARETAAGIEANFREQLRRHDLRGDWQLAAGEDAWEIGHRARTADLLVLGKPDPARSSAVLARRLLENALMTTGRPLLLVPFAAGTETIGSNVLLAWNGSREAARAMHDALLLMEPGARVLVLTIVPPGTATASELPEAQIAGHLARHGLDVSVTRTVAGGVPEADLLLNYAADHGADLLVAGGYGHSRTHELVLGGVTRSLLAHTTLPVLMSH